MLTVKRKDHDIEADEGGGNPDEPLPEAGRHKAAKAVTKAALAKKALKKNIRSNQKIQFDDDGQGVDVDATVKKSKEGQDYDVQDDGEDGGGMSKSGFCSFERT